MMKSIFANKLSVFAVLVCLVGQAPGAIEFINTTGRELQFRIAWQKAIRGSLIVDDVYVSGWRTIKSGFKIRQDYDFRYVIVKDTRGRRYDDQHGPIGFIDGRYLRFSNTRNNIRFGTLPRSRKIVITEKGLEAFNAYLAKKGFHDAKRRIENEIRQAELENDRLRLENEAARRRREEELRWQAEIRRRERFERMRPVWEGHARLEELKRRDAEKYRNQAWERATNHYGRRKFPGSWISEPKTLYRPDHKRISSDRTRRLLGVSEQMRDRVVGYDGRQPPAPRPTSRIGAYVEFRYSNPRDSTTGIATFTRVSRGGPADRAGISVGDRMISVNGEPVYSLEDYARAQRLKDDLQIVVESKKTGRFRRIRF